MRHLTKRAAGAVLSLVLTVGPVLAFHPVAYAQAEDATMVSINVPAAVMMRCAMEVGGGLISQAQLAGLIAEIKEQAKADCRGSI